MNEVFVFGFSKSAWIGLLTITPAVVVTGLLLWLYALQQGHDDQGR